MFLGNSLLGEFCGGASSQARGSVGGSSMEIDRKVQLQSSVVSPVSGLILGLSGRSARKQSCFGLRFLSLFMFGFLIVDRGARTRVGSFVLR